MSVVFDVEELKKSMLNLVDATKRQKIKESKTQIISFRKTKRTPSFIRIGSNFHFLKSDCSKGEDEQAPREREPVSHERPKRKARRIKVDLSSIDSNSDKYTNSPILTSHSTRNRRALMK